MDYDQIFEVVRNRIAEDEFQEIATRFMSRGYKLPDPVNRSSFMLAVYHSIPLREELRNYLRTNFPDRLGDLDSDNSTGPSNAPKKLIFANREEEIADLSSDRATPTAIVTGPAGFGKTELLLELKHRYIDKGWLVAYGTVPKDSTVTDLAAVLALELGIDPETLFPTNTEIPLGTQFASVLIPHMAKSSKEGLVFLIDFNGNASFDPPRFRELIRFISTVNDSLRIRPIFKHGHMPFRVIVAGRNLADEIKRYPQLGSYFEKKKPLEPFNYDVILLTAQRYLEGSTSNEALPDLAAHLLFMTGGHPGCLAKLMDLYEHDGLTPNDFFLYRNEKIWWEVVQPVTEIVRDGIPESFQGLRRIFDLASVFRWLDSGILRFLLKVWEEELNQEQDPILQDQSGKREEQNSEMILIERHVQASSQIAGFLEHPGQQPEHALANRLTETYLYSRERRLLRDAITRRLLAIRFRYCDPEGFRSQCLNAQRICAEYILGKDQPERWMIEFLFQWLQQYANDIQEDQQRINIRRQFFAEVLPKGMYLYFHERIVAPFEAQDEYDALIDALHEDWEFIFTVNFILRKDEYSNEPFEELHEKILASFEGRGSIAT